VEKTLEIVKEEYLLLIIEKSIFNIIRIPCKFHQSLSQNIAGAMSSNGLTEATL
jgi:hypothetical protein